MIERSVLLMELEKQLCTAAKSLKDAWRLCKRNGIDKTAKELADTVLDVEMAHQLVLKELERQPK